MESNARGRVGRPKLGHRISRRSRSAGVLLAMLALSCAAVAMVVELQQRASASRDAETKMLQLQLQLSEMQDIPWMASPDQGRPLADVREQFVQAQSRFERDLADLASGDAADADLAAVQRPFRRTIEPLESILKFASAGDVEGGSKAAAVAWLHAAAANAAMTSAAKVYRNDAARDVRLTLYGSGTAIGLLFVAFAVFFSRSARARREAERLADENHDLFLASHDQATTDALTGLGNRRALTADLDATMARADQVVLALFDLDGFKAYNDTFGHPAGDSLLARLGERLSTTLRGFGDSYRMGGDEFCVVAPVSGVEECETVVRLAASALSEQGEAFQIRASYGYVLAPGEATTPEQALRLADQRMYSQKASGRASAGRQSADVLVKALAARSGDLQDHVSDVGRLAEATGRAMGLPEETVNMIRLGAELHDVGKVGIPDAILSKPGKLDDEEWEFMRRHTVIGERIVRAAPALQHAAGLVRSSHERMDGRGYPDGLSGDEIPTGAQVIAVCDAYDAMISNRVYRPGKTPDEALAELQRCAGTQFDPDVVRIFTAMMTGDRRRQDSPTAACSD